MGPNTKVQVKQTEFEGLGEMDIENFDSSRETPSGIPAQRTQDGVGAKTYPKPFLQRAQRLVTILARSV
jgi:hypothetical protein